MVLSVAAGVLPSSRMPRMRKAHRGILLSKRDVGPRAEHREQRPCRRAVRTNLLYHARRHRQPDADDDELSGRNRRGRAAHDIRCIAGTADYADRQRSWTGRSEERCLFMVLHISSDSRLSKNNMQEDREDGMIVIEERAP